MAGTIQGRRADPALLRDQALSLRAEGRFAQSSLFGVGLFGLVWGVVNDSKLILGSSALFAGTAILWPFNNLRRIRSEEIEIQTAPDRVRAGINACMAKEPLGEIAACFDENLKRLDRAFEELRKPTTP